MQDLLSTSFSQPLGPLNNREVLSMWPPGPPHSLLSHPVISPIVAVESLSRV